MLHASRISTEHEQARIAVGVARHGFAPAQRKAKSLLRHARGHSASGYRRQVVRSAQSIPPLKAMAGLTGKAVSMP
jgi:hypothetical protein